MNLLLILAQNREKTLVDLAILKDNRVIMLIECKDWRVDISKADVSQLYRYFTAVTEARIGVLTNGIIYRFYTDSEKPNVMDTKPFFEFNMSKIQQPLVNVLNNFTKDNFDLDHICSTAIDLKHRGDIKQILIKQLETPTHDFVDFFRNAIRTQMEVQDFTDVVKRAFNEFVDELTKKEHKGSDVSIAKFTNLRVTMPDESVIHHHNGKDTYIDVLEKLELEKVMQVRPNIVSTEQFPLKTKGIKRGKYWVRGMSGFSTKDRKAELDKIADLLGVTLIVETVVKKPKSS